MENFHRKLPAWPMAFSIICIKHVTFPMTVEITLIVKKNSHNNENNENLSNIDTRKTLTNNYGIGHGELNTITLIF